jgi:hypothetical protein
MFCSRREKKDSVEHNINMTNTCNLINIVIMMKARVAREQHQPAEELMGSDST